MKKILVVFYSRTGNTRRVGEQIAENLNADIDNIIDKKDRSGVRGWLGGGRDAFLQKQTKINYSKNPADYDLVVIGTPIWAGTAVPAINTYLNENRLDKVAFFCTCGDKQSRAWGDMTSWSAKPLATMELKDKEVGADSQETRKKIEDFVNKLK